MGISNSKQKGEIQYLKASMLTVSFYRCARSILRRVSTQTIPSNWLVLESAFSEGDGATRSIHSASSECDDGVLKYPRADPHCLRRKILPTEESFEILHTILYYLYSGRVFFRSGPEVIGPPGIPVYCDAEEIFAIAHRFVLPELKMKAITFFSRTCDVENIVERVFSDFGLVYEEIAKVYGWYFLSNWNNIRKRKELDSYFEELENDNSPRLVKVSKRFRDLMKDTQELPQPPQPPFMWLILVFFNCWEVLYNLLSMILTLET